MFGSRKMLGAASIPATAPSTAASPQPSDSIHVTRTPTSRASAGLTAAARIASPTFVYWKNSQSTTTVARTTPIVPMSWIEIATPPMSIVRVGNGLCTARTSPAQISVTRPLIARSRPIVTITTRSTRALLVRAGSRPGGSPTPPTNEAISVNDERGPVRPAVVRRQRPGDVGRERRHLALGEVDHPGRAVDQDERERERGVDRRRRRAPRRPVARSRPSVPEVAPSHGLVLPELGARPGRRRRGRPRARTRSTRVWSAIRASCSTTSTVSPSFSFSSRTIRKISRTIIGARPSDGSSSISSRGRAISARATASICCSPPDSVPAGCCGAVRDPREPLATPGRCPPRRFRSRRV